jgi:predicted nucleic acid-binding protein
MRADALMLTAASLPVSIVARQVYSQSIARARKRISWRDLDDLELLVLTLHFEIPLWSNNNDFDGCGVERFTTAELLRILGI